LIAAAHFAHAAEKEMIVTDFIDQNLSNVLPHPRGGGFFRTLGAVLDFILKAENEQDPCIGNFSTTRAKLYAITDLTKDGKRADDKTLSAARDDALLAFQADWTAYSKCRRQR